MGHHSNHMKVFAIGSPVLTYESSESGLRIPGHVKSRDLSLNSIDYSVSIDGTNEVFTLPAPFVLPTKDSTYEEIEI